MSGPYAGLTVVELGQFVVVPFCAQLLADAGARVIKVEPLTGDSYRSWEDGLGETQSRQFLIKNRGKESVAVDLGHPDGAQVVRRLLEVADVVLVNLSPAAVRRRGLDYESVREVNPRIVYGAVSAYGHVGPEAPLPGMDVVVQARSGLLTSLGAERDGVPHHSEVQVADYASSLLLFGGIGAALYARERTGEGQEVTVSLLAGALAVQNNSLGHVHEHDGWRQRFVGEQLPAFRAEGADHARVEATRRAQRPDAPQHTAHYRVFATSDGYVAVGAGSPAARRRLCELVDLPEELPTADPAAFGELLATALRQRTTDDWVTALREAQVPVAPVRHVDELFFDEHVLAEGLLVDYDHPSVGSYRALGVPVRMGGTPWGGAPPAPELAGHTASVLTELGYTAAEISALAEQRAVRVAAPARRSN